MLLFQEITSLIWWTGTTLVIIGLAIIAKNAELSPAASVSKIKDK
jgi:hypothetical protein